MIKRTTLGADYAICNLTEILVQCWKTTLDEEGTNDDNDDDEHFRAGQMICFFQLIS